MNADRTDEEVFWEVVKYDWMVSETDELLHAPGPETKHVDYSAEGAALCGHRADYWHIPGLFTRLSTPPRCDACCDASGLPRGKGCPKNDAACRPLVGLDGGA